jgi:tetratricopeptide (TPR) repeat protein
MERAGMLVVRAELVDVGAESQLWSEQYNRKVADIFAVQEEIAKEISEKLRLRLTGEEQKSLTRRYTENAEAYQLYLRGRYYWNKRTTQALKKALEHFEQAIEKDPAYALAYTGLADSYNSLGFYGALSPQESFPKAQAAARKALAVDDALAEAHVSLGYFKLFYEWDWAGAEREFKRAIELNPNYATAYQFYGLLLKALGRPEESVVQNRKARELDPLTPTINYAFGSVFYAMRQYDRAIEEFRKVLEPNFPLTSFGLARAYEAKGMYAEAIAEFQKAVGLLEREPLALHALGHAYAVSGKRSEARKVLEELHQLREQRYVSAYWIAVVYAGLGENDQAWEWFERAYEERASFLGHDFKTDPRLDGLRSDPRYQDLLKRMGLGS